MRSDLEAAVALVKGGKTYSEAAKQLGLRRNQVAGACDRAGLKFSIGRAGTWPRVPGQS